MTDGQMFKFDFGYLFSVYTLLVVSAKILGMLNVDHRSLQHYYSTLLYDYPHNIILVFESCMESKCIKLKYLLFFVKSLNL